MIWTVLFSLKSFLIQSEEQAFQTSLTVCLGAVGVAGGKNLLVSSRSTRVSWTDYIFIFSLIFSSDFPNPGIESRPLTLQADSFPSEPPGKPKNTGVGSLSLFQRNFPTQKSIQGLLHCMQILYQLSYQGSPTYYIQIIIQNRWWGHNFKIHT